MKPHIIIILFATLISCQTKKEKILKKDKAFSFFVGTYTDSLSKGIYKYTLAQDGSLKRLNLAAVSNNPSFLTRSADNKYIVVVNEINTQDGAGTIESYAIKNDSLTFISRSNSGGAHPCFVSINEAGYVLTANYTGGNVGLLKLSTKGELSDLLDVQQHTGKGVVKQQDAPHAHSAWFAPDKTIISVDLGTNGLWFSQIDTSTQKLIPTSQQPLQMASGAGPRHLTFHPNNKWVYIINELTNTVTFIIKNKNQEFEKIASFSTLPDDYSETSYCADIHISSDGKFLYASNRGHNSLAIFEINPDNGYLKLIANESVHGNWPRNFSLSPDENYILVANQLTNNIISFKRDKTTGLLQFIDEIKAPSPVCILF